MGGGGSRPGDLSLPPGSPSAQPVLPRPGRKPLRSLRAAQVKDRRLQQLRNGIRRGLASRAGAAPPGAHARPLAAAGPLVCENGRSVYHASHAGSRLRCPAPPGSLCSPPAQEAAEAQAPALRQPRLNPLGSSRPSWLGAHSSPHQSCVWEPPVQDSLCLVLSSLQTPTSKGLDCCPRVGTERGLLRARAICQQPREKAATVASV